MRGDQIRGPSPGWDRRLRWWLTEGKAQGKLPPGQWFTGKNELRCSLCCAKLTPEESRAVPRRSPPFCKEHAKEVQEAVQGLP